MSCCGIVRRLVGLGLLLIVTACAGGSFHSQTRYHGFETGKARGEVFLHQFAYKPGAGEVLHVYIEGDGRPWLQDNRIALDPTPGKPLMLELMALDPAPAIYLGRPCYFGLDDPNCSPRWWTDQRYSLEVVRSMNAALDTAMQGYRRIALIGHSGGGALAMLMAQNRVDVIALITLAGNLDTAAWLEYHDYTALTGSLNPAMQEPLPSSIAQLHFLGAFDRNITREMITPMLARQFGAGLQVVANIDHTCCWLQVWPEILEQLETNREGTEKAFEAF